MAGLPGAARRRSTARRRSCRRDDVAVGRSRSRPGLPRPPSSRPSASRSWPSRARPAAGAPTRRPFSMRAAMAMLAVACVALLGVAAASPSCAARRGSAASRPPRWLRPGPAPRVTTPASAACRAPLLASGSPSSPGARSLALRAGAPTAGCARGERGAAGGSARPRAWSTPPPPSPSRCGASSPSSTARPGPHDRLPPGVEILRAVHRVPERDHAVVRAYALRPLVARRRHRGRARAPPAVGLGALYLLYIVAGAPRPAASVARRQR